MEKCLLVITKDNRRFLTHKKNLTDLMEFAKTFHVEIYLAKPEPRQKILPLRTLAKAFCNPECSPNPQCLKLARLYPTRKKSRSMILKDAVKIQRYIQNRLLGGHAVSLKELKHKYSDCKLTDACLCNHLSLARKYLINKGHTFSKVGAGTYLIR